MNIKTIHATGQWGTGVCESEPCWVINTSDILTELIQYAGRYCEHFASDLFILWDYKVQRKLKERDLESFELLLGFRESGVDDNETVEKHRRYNLYYYRKIVKLSVVVYGNQISMTLNC